MRKGTSIAAAALSATLAVNFISPVSAQPAPGQGDTTATSTIDLSSTPEGDQVPQSTCIGVGLAAGIPLLLLLTPWVRP